MARHEQQRTLLDLASLGLGCLGGFGTFIAINGSLVSSADSAVLAIIVTLACRTGFCGSLKTLFRAEGGLATRVFSAAIALMISLSMIALIAQKSGWQIASSFLAIDALIFGLVATSALALRQERTTRLSRIGDQIGVFEILREFSRQQGELTVLYLPQPPHSNELDRAARAFIGMAACTHHISGPWVVDVNHVERSLLLTHEHLFRHEPRCFEIYHLHKNTLAELLAVP